MTSEKKKLEDRTAAPTTSGPCTDSAKSSEIKGTSLKEIEGTPLTIVTLPNGNIHLMCGGYNITTEPYNDVEEAEKDAKSINWRILGPAICAMALRIIDNKTKNNEINEGGQQ